MIGKVLVIAYYFPPMGLSGVQRTLKFVKYLPQYDWQPVVLTTADPVYYAFDDTLGKDIDPEKTIIYRTEKDPTQRYKLRKNSDTGKTTIEYPSRTKEIIRKRILQTIFQPDSRKPWLKHALNEGRKAIREQGIDVIYATAPPFTDFLVAKQLSEEFDIPFIVDYRDLWVDNAYYVYTTPFHKQLAVKMESEVLNTANKALVTGRYMKEQMLKRYNFLNHNDINILPHGYDSEDFEEADTGIRPDSNYFTLTHSGLFPDDLTPKYFLKAVRRYLDKHPGEEKLLRLRFAGLLRKRHMKLIKKYKLQEITDTQGYLPHDEAVRNLLSSDVLWFMIPNNIATPSRLYEYIGSRRPMIISAPAGNIRDAAEGTGAAITTEHDDVNAIAQAIEDFRKLHKAGKLPQTPKEYAMQFDRKHLTKDLARELNLLLR
jgi:glycosyltransferase involved in cell wall biosynthesis